MTVTAVVGNASTHGIVLLVAGNVVYTPDLTYVGPASFAYTVCDNGTTDAVADPKCSTGTVNVTVTPILRLLGM